MNPVWQFLICVAMLAGIAAAGTTCTFQAALKQVEASRAVQLR